jgi:hypothetical protein
MGKNMYFSEETAKKLAKIGFFEEVQYFKIKDKKYLKLPEPNELVEWLRDHMDTYIVVVPDPGHPLRHQFNYFVYAPDYYNNRPRLVSEGVHFDFDSATIDAILDYLNKEVL